MDQYELLEVFNNLNEFSSDDSSMQNVRNSLLLGDFSLQDEDNIAITSGNIEIDTFFIRSNDANANANANDLFLTISNTEGAVTFGDISLPSWVSSNLQNKVLVSGFSNDHVYVSSNIFNYDIRRNTFIFDESLLQLENRPSFDTIATAFGYPAGFAVAISNLDDVLNPGVARLNLGIGDIGTQSTLNALFTHAKILSNVSFPFLTTTVDTYIGKINNLAVNRTYDFPLLLDVLPSTISTSDSNILLPTSKLVHDTFSNLSNVINVKGRENIEFIQNNAATIIEYLQDDAIVTITNYLKKMADADSNAVGNIQSNLSIGNIASQNSNDVSLKHITFSSIHSRSNSVYYDNNIVDLDTFLQTTKNPGFVTLAESVSFENSLNSFTAFTNTIENVREEMRDNNNFDDFSEEMFNSNDNLGYYSSTGSGDAIYARTNLGLHAFAYGGRLVDLENRPTYLSELNNDTNYIAKNNSLSEVDETIAVQNLGISNMAFISTDLGGNNLRPSTLLGTSCTIDYLALNDGTLNLRVPEFADFDFDFLYLEGTTAAESVNGYKYSRINIADELYMQDEHFSNVDALMRVRLNDISGIPDVEREQVLARVRPDDPYKIAPILNSTNVPTAEFAYKRIAEMTSNILTIFEVPFEYYKGWL